MSKLFLGILFAATTIIGFADAIATHKNVDCEQHLIPKSRSRKTKRTLVFSQAQLKYGLNTVNVPYIGRWIDRPLFIDPSIPRDPKREGALWFNDFVKMQEILGKYALDGFAIFAENSSNLTGLTGAIYDKANRSPIKDFCITSILYSSPRPDDLARKITIVGKALDCRKSLFLDDKLVIFITRSERTEYWQNVMNELRRKYGDRFIFIGEIVKLADKYVSEWIGSYNDKSITPNDIKNIKEHLRQQLRVLDGIISSNDMLFVDIDDDKNFHLSFYRDFIIKIFQCVLSEEEFKCKYFALGAAIGHENCESMGYVLSHDGTKTLRNSLEAAISANPDIIIIPEWDEQNENTSIRPTVYNGLSSMRIMRYYMAKLEGRPIIPMPGDRTDMPNLTISFRKLLCLGEKIKIELLNIPDSEKNEPYSVRLMLKDIDGIVLKEFSAVSFNSNEMGDHTLEIASEEFARHQVLLPALDIEYRGEKISFEEGLHYIELRPTWNWDYKWVKQPLRDLLMPGKVSFRQIDNPGGLLKSFSAQISSPEDLAYVGILDNDDLVYIAGMDDKHFVRETTGEKALVMVIQLLKGISVMNGGITVENAVCKWYRPTNETSASRTMIAKNNSLKFNNTNVFAPWPIKIYFSIPSEQVDNALLDISIPGMYTGRIPVKKIIDNQVFAISGEKLSSISISRFIRQIDYPKHLNSRSAIFDVDLIPDLKNSVIHMEAITKNGKTFRSKPILMKSRLDQEKPDKEISVFSDSLGKPVRINIDARRVPDLKYKFTPEYGSALVCEEGRGMWGILGGFAPQVTLRGGGESGYGTPFIHRPYPASAKTATPDWVKEENGEYSLVFDGIGTFIVLPQGAIPRRAGFEISMKIMQDEDAHGNKQFVLGNRTHYPGALYDISLENGFLIARYFGLNNGKLRTHVADSGKSRFHDKIKITQGKWSDIRIIYDLENIVFEVNGQKTEKFECPGPGLYDTLTVIGGFGESWFKGKIKDLKITHAISE